MGKSERDNLTEDATDTMDHLFSGEINSHLDMSVGAPGPDILCKLPEMFLRATARRMEIEAESGMMLLAVPDTNSPTEITARFRPPRLRDGIV